MSKAGAAAVHLLFSFRDSACCNLEGGEENNRISRKQPVSWSLDASKVLRALAPSLAPTASASSPSVPSASSLAACLARAAATELPDDDDF